MTKQFTQKNIMLSLELDEYLIQHPELYDKIPHGAVIVITMKKDKQFSKDSITIARNYRTRKPFIQAEKVDSKWVLSPLNLKTVSAN